ncbi:MAG: hypothetical protein H7287_04700 [Thermoleophilia bacterium]|nr:hypothetical protein [Thermoleophilia bacterium]
MISSLHVIAHATAAPELTPIPKIQGSGTASSLLDKPVTTSGVITGIGSYTDKQGVAHQEFYVQDPAGDGNAKTSDALVARPTGTVDAKVGQAILVSGTVSEYHEITAIDGATISVDPNGTADAKLAPTLLKLPSTETAAATYLEARESMLSGMDDTFVVTPTQSYGTFTVVDAVTHGPNKDYDKHDQASHLQVASGLGERIEVATGDRITGIVGPLDQGQDAYQILLRDKVHVVAGPKPPAMWGDLDGDGSISAGDLAALKARQGSAASGPLDAADLDGNGKVTASDTKLATARAARMASTAPTFSVANVNAENFFDTVDDAHKRDTVVSPAQLEAKVAGLAKLISGELDGPSIVAMEEVENATVLEALLQAPSMQALGYKFELLPGPDLRGINTALLYRAEQGITVSNVRQLQGKSDLGKKPGSDLFARPPLTIDVDIKGPKGMQDERLTVLVNHFMSAYSPGGTPTEPWRIEQSKFIVDAANDLQKAAPDRNVLVIGDLNANESSKPITMLSAAGSPLENVTERYVPKGERYSYTYMGSAEQLDHMFLTKQAADRVQFAGVHHVHADQPAAGSARPTDHDIVETRIEFAPTPAR